MIRYRAGSFFDVLSDAGLEADFAFVAAAPSAAAIAPAADIIGTADADYLVGTSEADTISGLGGDDWIQGNDGDDALYGGAGDDIIFGGRGNDFIEGGDGNDFLRDVLGGNNRLFGGAGVDVIVVRSLYGGAIEVDAGEGDDIVRVERGGPGGTLDIHLGAGNDLAVLGFGFPGGESPETIDLWLGDGIDTIDLRGLPALATVHDFAAGDRIVIERLYENGLTGLARLENPFATGHLSLVQEGADAVLLVDADGGGDGYRALLVLENTQASSLTAVDFGGFSPDGAPLTGLTLVGTHADDRIYGGAGDDVLHGRLGADSIFGGWGDDTLTGGGGADRLYGGEGNDLIYGGAGNDHIEGDEGDDEIYAGGGDDSVFHTSGADRIYLGAGDDWVAAQSPFGLVVYGEDGNDTLELGVDGYASAEFHGGKGADTVQVWLQPDTGIVDLDFNLGLGADTLRTVTPYPSWANLFGTVTATLGSGRDTLDLDIWGERFEITDFQTGGIGDVLGGGVISRAFATGSLVVSRDGADTVLSAWPGGPYAMRQELRLANVDIAAMSLRNFGDDVFAFVGHGTSAADTLEGTHGADWLVGGAGDDVLSGLDGSDVLRGGGGADELRGGAGNDLLFGGAGDDLLIGGGDADYLAGGAGRDTVSFEGAAEAITADLVTGTASYLNGSAGTLVSIENLIGTDFDDRLDGNGSANRLDGGKGADQLFGKGGDDILVGAQGDDVLDGGWGNDVLLGGWGDDVLDGGAGDDILNGGRGNDILRGGNGTGDVAVFQGNQNEYVITEQSDGTIIVEYVGSAHDTGIDTLTGIERLRFADATVELGSAEEELIETLMFTAELDSDRAGPGVSWPVEAAGYGVGEASDFALLDDADWFF